MGSVFGGAGIIMMLFMLVVGVLWILVPFAVFGIKPILIDIRNELRKANALAEQAQRAPLPVPRADVPPLS